MAAIDLVAGTRCLFQGKAIRLRQIVDLKMVVGEYESTGIIATFPIHALQPIVGTAPTVHDAFVSVPPAAYAKAQRKLEIIQPLIVGGSSAEKLAEIAHLNQIGVSTLRRWVSAYKHGGSVLALVEQEHTGGKGKSRLTPEVEAIVQKAITDHYLTPQSKTPTHVLEEIQRMCRLAGLRPPTAKSLRLRLHRIKEEVQVRRRSGLRAAKEQFEPIKANTLQVPHPLAVVQLDHALLNIVLVHETTRQPMSRPWLTIATDVFSRMVVGFYLAFEEPGAGGTGLCLAQAILPKETWLSRRDVKGEWPCWGTMETLHLDNAKEFHGTMLQRASERYGIRLLYRPPHRPEYGGNIERLIRTIKFHIRRLAGSLLPPSRRRRRQTMPQKAVFSLPEFERWLATYIVNVYHHRVHSSLGVSPYERYQKGLFGSPEQPGIGPRPRRYDELQVQLDFMPLVERSIQRYGVLIERFHYYADVLRPFIDAHEAGTGRQVLRKFIFKRDPRDLSCIYFLHPDTQQYHTIPLAHMGRPSISLWEQREIIRRELLLNPDRKRLSEDIIFQGLAQLVSIAQEAVKRTGKMTKAARRLLEVTPKKSGTASTMIIQHSKTTQNVTYQSDTETTSPAEHPAVLSTANTLPVIEPFEQIDDGTSDLRRRKLAKRNK